MSDVMLTPLDWDDMKTLLQWRNIPSNQIYFREYRPLNDETQGKWYNSLTDDRNTIMFAIVKGNKLVGVCGLCNIDWVNRHAEMSLYIGDGYIDRMIAPNAWKQLENYAIKVLGLKRLWAEIWGFDVKKRDLLIAKGYQLEVTKREAHWHNGWHNAEVYGRLLDD